jgi:hypothetical protein
MIETFIFSILREMSPIDQVEGVHRIAVRKDEKWPSREPALAGLWLGLGQNAQHLHGNIIRATPLQSQLH